LLISDRFYRWTTRQNNSLFVWWILAALTQADEKKDTLELTAMTALTILRRRKLAPAAERKQAERRDKSDRLIKSKEGAIR
jgi:hypothetical protein